MQIIAIIMAGRPYMSAGEGMSDGKLYQMQKRIAGRCTVLPVLREKADSRPQKASEAGK